ncbi:MAG: ABC transporter permease [Actinobacteria bacterium]|nr:ABC transporter permease [Actinomycetota bacterium]
MNQVSATYIKGLKDNFMSKPALFWVIAWPAIWLLLAVFVFLRGVPLEFAALAKGQSTISMVTFSIMVCGMTSLPANISEDRQRGLFQKLKTMPVQPWKEAVGKILAVLTFGLVSVAIIIIIGVLLGARFNITLIGLLKSLGFLLLGTLASAGVGLIVGSLIKSVQGAIMTGVGIAVVTSAISGVFFQYSMLPPVLQKFSKIWPMSSANSIIISYLIGDIGYNPLTYLNLSLTIIISLLFFSVGIVLYTVYCWRSE